MDRKIRALFLDAGGLLFSNGWSTEFRRGAAQHFGIDYSEMERLYQGVISVLETGHLTLDDYLDLVVFNRERPFRRDVFRDYLFPCQRPTRR